MEAFTVHTGRAVPLRRSNVDTDQIIPAHWLKKITRDGYEDGLFEAWRKDPQFVLNQPAHQGATVLVAGPDFGTGSSREHAVWALQNFGFKTVISSRFADIFRGNSLKNGLLAIVVSAAEHRWLLDNPGVELRIDIADGSIRLPDGGTIRFDLDAFSRHCLLNGVDQMGFLLQQEAAITAFEHHMGEAA